MLAMRTALHCQTVIAHVDSQLCVAVPENFAWQMANRSQTRNQIAVIIICFAPCTLVFANINLADACNNPYTRMIFFSYTQAALSHRSGCFATKTSAVINMLPHALFFPCWSCYSQRTCRPGRFCASELRVGCTSPLRPWPAGPPLNGDYATSWRLHSSYHV